MKREGAPALGNLLTNEVIYIQETDRTETETASPVLLKDKSFSIRETSGLQTKIRDSPMKANFEFDLKSNCEFYSFQNNPIKIKAGGRTIG